VIQWADTAVTMDTEAGAFGTAVILEEKEKVVENMAAVAAVSGRGHATKSTCSGAFSGDGRCAANTSSCGGVGCVGFLGCCSAAVPPRRSRDEGGVAAADVAVEKAVRGTDPVAEALTTKNHENWGRP
jgi:hypothetical protein